MTDSLTRAAERHLTSRFNARAWSIPNLSYHEHPVYMDVYLVPESREGCETSAMRDLLAQALRNDHYAYLETEITPAPPTYVLTEDDLTAIASLPYLVTMESWESNTDFLIGMLAHPHLPNTHRVTVLTEFLNMFDSNDMPDAPHRVAVSHLAGLRACNDECLALLVPHADMYQIYSHPNAGPSVASAYMSIEGRQVTLHADEMIALACMEGVPEWEQRDLLARLGRMNVTNVASDFASAKWPVRAGEILSPDFHLTGVEVEMARSVLILHAATYG